ncbi:tryptophan-rich sensory protein [Candidatus Peregrinibacteria bacterium]|nr:MAG: tryptophan-rich sensory protein [Candidatus Peregrinibacteria bacterium]
MNTWYAELIKPEWAPPSSLFGPVWTVLYIIIGITFGYVFLLFSKKKISFCVLVPFVLNLLFNLLFTPIQFGLKNNLLSAVDILLVLGTLFWFLFAIYPYSRWVTYANIPYLFWVIFASVLQLTITYLNL